MAINDKIKAVKNFFTKSGKRNLIIACAVLLIGAAVYVNWALFGGGPDENQSGNGDAMINGGVTDGENNDDQVSGEKNDEVDYFAASLIERQRARDEAIEVLQGVVDDATAIGASKEQALADIAAIAANIEMEANIESLIKAKGFEECVAVISGDKANIVVKSEGLKPNQLSQILEIVYLQADIVPANVTISEK